jgi:hypothetical protein
LQIEDIHAINQQGSELLYLSNDQRSHSIFSAENMLARFIIRMEEKRCERQIILLSGFGYRRRLVDIIEIGGIIASISFDPTVTARTSGCFQMNDCVTSHHVSGSGTLPCFLSAWA